MLVLSRHKDEQVVIGDEIVVTVVDIGGGKVRLGFDAPKDVAIHRREVHEAIQRDGSRRVVPITEGKSKGGLNPNPSSARPPGPQGSGGKLG